MKKQFALPALILSLSFAYSSFALDQKKISDKQKLQNEVFELAKHPEIPAYTNNKKLLEDKKKYIIDTVFTGAVTIALAAINYLCLTNQLSTIIEKKELSALSAGFNFLSHALSNISRKDRMRYQQAKDNILKNYIVPQLEETFDHDITTYIKNKYLHKPLITEEEFKELEEITLKTISLETLPERLLEKQALLKEQAQQALLEKKAQENLLSERNNKSTEKPDKVKKNLLNESERTELHNFLEQVRETIKNKSNNESTEKPHETIKSVKKRLLDENNIESIPSEIREAVKGLKKITEYSNSKCEQVKKHYYTGSHYKNTILAGLFGLTNVSIWAPEICSNFAKMTNFAVPYFNNIKIPNFTKKFPFTKS